MIFVHSSTMIMAFSYNHGHSAVDGAKTKERGFLVSLSLIMFRLSLSLLWPMNWVNDFEKESTFLTRLF